MHACWTLFSKFISFLNIFLQGKKIFSYKYHEIFIHKCHYIFNSIIDPKINRAVMTLQASLWWKGIYSRFGTSSIHRCPFSLKIVLTISKTMISLSSDPYSVPERNGSCFTLWGIAIMHSHWDRKPIRVLRHALGLLSTCKEKDKNKRQPGGRLGPASSTRHWDVSPTHRKETYSIKNSLETENRRAEKEKSDGVGCQ